MNCDDFASKRSGSAWSRWLAHRHARRCERCRQLSGLIDRLQSAPAPQLSAGDQARVLYALSAAPVPFRRRIPLSQFALAMGVLFAFAAGWLAGRIQSGNAHTKLPTPNEPSATLAIAPRESSPDPRVAELAVVELPEIAIRPQASDEMIASLDNLEKRTALLTQRMELAETRAWLRSTLRELSPDRDARNL